MVLALQSHSSRYALKMSMSGPGFKPQGHLCLERMGRRLASTIKCFENWQRCSNFVIFYQIHSPPCNTKWCIFNYMQTCWINFSYGHDMLHDSGTWVASVAQTWHVCVCVWRIASRTHTKHAGELRHPIVLLKSSLHLRSHGCGWTVPQLWFVPHLHLWWGCASLWFCILLSKLELLIKITDL